MVIIPVTSLLLEQTPTTRHATVTFEMLPPCTYLHAHMYAGMHAHTHANGIVPGMHTCIRATRNVIMALHMLGLHTANGYHPDDSLL